MTNIDADQLSSIVDGLRSVGTDTLRVEVKSAAGGLPKSIPSTVSAFANGDGGLVILGLDEKSGFVRSQPFDAVAIADALSNLARSRKAHEHAGPLTPAPKIEIDLLEFEGGPVVVADVLPLGEFEKPCFVTSVGRERGSYERLADGDHVMSTYAIFNLLSNRTQPLDDVQPVAGTAMTDIDPALLPRLLDRVRRTRPRVMYDNPSDQTVLERLNVVDEKSGNLTKAGVLALARYPQQHFPQLVVSFAVYPGNTKDSVQGDVRMLDRATMEGPIPAIADDAVRAVIRNLQVRRISAGGSGAADQPEIPVDALREAIVNALAHRDYSALATGQQVRIEMYPDRVEVISPGGIWGGRRQEDLFDGTSRSRNATLTRLLTDVPFENRDETVSENLGSGIQRMVGTMRQFGLPSPSFRSKPTEFATVLARHGLMDPQVSQWLREIGADSLSEEKRLALAIVRKTQEIDDQVLRRELGMDSLDALLVLNELSAGGWLVARAAGRFAPGARLLQPQVTLPLFDLPMRGRSLDDQIMQIVLEKSEVSIGDLVHITGVKIGTLRLHLRRLIDLNQIEATTPPTSRNRKYRLVS